MMPGRSGGGSGQRSPMGPDVFADLSSLSEEGTMPDVTNVVSPTLVRPDPARPEGAWRDGKVVVLRAGAGLPSRCVKCNAPADGPTKWRRLYWHHPAIYLLILISILIYAIVALIVRKQAVVNPGLCAAHKRRRLAGILGGWAGVVLGLGLLIFGVADDSGWTALAGVALFFGGLFGGMVLAYLVSPARVDKDAVRLRGCGSAFLESLPEFSAWAAGQRAGIG